MSVSSKVLLFPTLLFTLTPTSKTSFKEYFNVLVVSTLFFTSTYVSAFNSISDFTFALLLNAKVNGIFTKDFFFSSIFPGILSLYTSYLVFKVPISKVNSRVLSSNLTWLYSTFFKTRSLGTNILINTLFFTVNESFFTYKLNPYSPINDISSKGSVSSGVNKVITPPSDKLLLNSNCSRYPYFSAFTFALTLTFFWSSKGVLPSSPIRSLYIKYSTSTVSPGLISAIVPF